MKKYILFSVFFIAVLVSCNDPYDGSTYQVYNDNPISKYLEDQGVFDEWVKVLRYSNMYNALNEAGQPFTEFVPSDSAMNEFYKKEGVDSIQALGYEYARALVRAHTVLDTIQVDEFINSKSLTNLSGDKVSIEIDSVNSGEAVLNGEAHVTKMGISVSNGILYLLSGTMTPLVETVYDRVAENPDYSIMKEAIEATGWKDSLNITADTVIIDGLNKISKRYYTLLSVSDGSFAKDGISSLADLKGKINTTGDASLTDSLLFQYIGYHIIKQNYNLAEFEKFDGSDTAKLYDTQAVDQVLMVNYDSLATTDKYFLNFSSSRARFVESNCNVLAKNGYVHEIDNYLPVWEPEQTTVIWDLTDYSDVKDLVPEEDYQPSEPVSTEAKYSLLLAPCYTYEFSQSGTSNKSYSYLTYVNCKSNLRKANKLDCLVLNLGYMGNVSMKTPTLVKGKYKVELQFIYLSDHSFMKNMSEGNGGLMHITVDGKNDLNSRPYTTVTGILAGVKQATLYDEIDFDKTQSHIFKIVVMDPAASSNSKFSLQLDCITFTPITE